MNIKSIGTGLNTAVTRLKDISYDVATKLKDLPTRLRDFPYNNLPYNNTAVIGASALLVLGTMGYLGYFSHSSQRPVQTAPISAPVDITGITVTVVDDTSSATCPNPLEAVLTQAQDYVTQHPWQEIEQRYAGVPGGVIVSLHDYRGNDKKQACRLALGRLVETTLGSIPEVRTHPQYSKLMDAVITKGLNDCTKDMQLRYKNYRFGL